MSYGAGSLAITARRAGPRTILERLRFDGISRCSRAFRRDGAALVVLSQLGPGVVRGDAVTTSGRVRAGAHLIVTSQTATRLMGGAQRSVARASWCLEDGAVLELIGEPLVANGNANYDASTTIELGAGSYVLVSELARVPAGAAVRLRMCVRRDGRELFYDAFDAAATAPRAVGTFALIGLRVPAIGRVVAALDALEATIGTVRLGVGALPNGVFARVLATDVWAVRCALIALRETAWRAVRDCDSAAETAPAEPRVSVTP